MNIAILGFGTVGSGVYEVALQCNKGINVKSILDIRDFSGHPAGELFVDSYDVILNDSSISTVVETIGGLNPAYQYTKSALVCGKNVVTSNKELVAVHGVELSEIAVKNDVCFLFEASVGGGIPIIRPLQQCLAANQITEIYGILNGTTNYILTKMFKEGESFEHALAKAQQKGYAEQNPAADVEGHDTCRKIAILSSLAFGQNISCDTIPTRGITSIKKEDIGEAEASGCVIKLIGHAKIVDGEVQCKVEPMPIPKSSPLANVDGVYNGIMIHGEPVGDVMFYGRGAGKLPTASAVLADVIDIANRIERRRH